MYFGICTIIFFFQDCKRQLGGLSELGIGSMVKEIITDTDKNASETNSDSDEHGESLE